MLADIDTNSEDSEEMPYFVFVLFDSLRPLNNLSVMRDGKKCLRMQHFIRVYIVCSDNNNLQRKEMQFYFQIKTCDPLMYTMDLPKFIVSIQKKEFISA